MTKCILKADSPLISVFFGHTHYQKDSWCFKYKQSSHRKDIKYYPNKNLEKFTFRVFVNFALIYDVAHA